MAKLPKVKSKQEEVDEEVVTTENEVTTDTSTDDGTADDQNGAVDSIITHTAETVSGSNEGSIDEDPDEGDEEDSTDEEKKTDGGEENKKDDDNFGVTIAPPKNTTPTKATTVKVATVCDHSCYIGGKPYHFKKGVPTNVPEPVKQILKNAGLLAAL